MSARAVSSVLIAGGGIVAWSAAAALRKKLPAVRVIVVAVPPPADALADRIGCTLPSIADFHHDIGLSETDAVLRAGSGFRLGTRFEGWTQGGSYIHGYGDYGRSLAASAFYQHWLRANAAGEAAPFDSYSGAAEFAAAGRFLPPEKSPVAQLSNYAYGLHIDPERYRSMMRAYALHLGAEERGASIQDVHLRDDGFIERITVDGSEIQADLFVDATGPAALLRSRIDREWLDWSESLTCDRSMMSDETVQSDAPALDQAIAFEQGWRWEASSPFRRSSGLVYSSNHLSSESAQRLLPGATEVTLKPGRFDNPWAKNCVAIGDSAIAIEPLEWTNLHLAHSAIDRLVAMMPDRDCNPVELWDYNRQVTAEADRVRDFVLLHYAASNRAEPFWKDAASRPLPQSLQHTLTQFRERGRLPFYEEETFARDSWAAVLIGQGVIPRRLDPLLDGVPPKESLRAMEQLRSAIHAAIAPAPTQTAYLRNLALQENR
jgi:tryptophan halogenase